MAVTTRKSAQHTSVLNLTGGLGDPETGQCQTVDHDRESEADTGLRSGFGESDCGTSLAAGAGGRDGGSG